MDFCLLLKLHHKGHKRRSFHEPPKKNASASKSSKSSKHLEKSTKIIKSPSNLDLFQPFPYVFFKGSRLGHASLELCHMQPQGRAVGLRSVAELRHQAAQGAGASLRPPGSAAPNADPAGYEATAGISLCMCLIYGIIMYNLKYFIHTRLYIIHTITYVCVYTYR